MTGEDRHRWDERYASQPPARPDAVGPPSLLAAYADAFPVSGRVLDLACGRGLASVWLALRGLHVIGLDISAVAIDQARDLARRSGVDERCRFDVVDLDEGLPPGGLVDVIVCHKFRDRRLDRAIVERLAPGGLLAMAVLSEVDTSPGPFRAAAGELPAAFAELELVVAGERGGHAWLLARASRSARAADYW